MKHRIAFGASLTIAFIGMNALAAGLESGPPVGKNIPGPFHVQNVLNAENPSVNGQKACLV